MKGAAVLLVLWGHCIQFSSAGYIDHYANVVFKFIYSFHMPLFMVISGYLFFYTIRKKSLKKVLLGRVTGILIPLAIWSAVSWVITPGIRLIVSRELASIPASLWSSFTGPYLWFLWSVLAASICAALCEDLLPGKWSSIGIILCYFAMYLFPNAEMNLYMYPFFSAGYFYRKLEFSKSAWNSEISKGLRNQLMKLSSNIKNKGGWACITIFMILLAFYRKEHYIYVSGISLWKSEYGVLRQMGIDVYRYAIGFAGSISAIWTGSRIKTVSGRIRCGLETCGQYSMQIYLLQCLFISILWSKAWGEAVTVLGFNPMTINGILYSFLITPAMAVIAVLVFVRITRVIEKNRRLARIIFGR